MSKITTTCDCIGCRSVSIHHARVPCVALPVEGSIRWAINRGKCWQINLPTYDTMDTWAETHEQAAQHTMLEHATHCTWLPPGTPLEVWNVYAGSIGGFIMRDAQRFVTRVGGKVEAMPTEVAK